MIIIFHKIQKEHQSIQEKIQHVRQQLAGLPEGRLCCTRNGRNCKWYKNENHNFIYIPKSDKELAKQLAVKEYYLCLLSDLTNEKNILDKCLKKYAGGACSLASGLLNKPGYRELLEEFFRPESEELFDWMEAPYEQNPKYPEQLVHKTSFGKNVRSKSEAMILMCLHLKRVPFRYECVLTLDDVTLFPDFTLRHPVSGEVYYWEHFGMMDDLTYSQKSFSKLQLYARHGIIPSINLITTYETKDKPLSMDIIDKTISHYFL